MCADYTWLARLDGPSFLLVATKVTVSGRVLNTSRQPVAQGA